MNKIAFFSTSSRPIKSLEKLANKFDICLIVTKTDRVIGRNKEIASNEVKKFAIKNNISLLEIDKMDLETKSRLEKVLREKKPDVALTFDFGYIVPKSLFEIPKYKFVNIHFSLLPKYRGASAVQFAILNDEKEYGVTYHLIDATLDTGDILYQSKFPLNENHNSKEAYDFLFDKTSEEINGILEQYLKGSLFPYPQDPNEASYTYSKSNPKYTFIFKDDALIDKINTERNLFRKIKAFNPWPKPEIKTSLLFSLNQFKNYELKNIESDPMLKLNDADFIDNRLVITSITILNGKSLNIRDFISGYLKKKVN